MVPGFRFLPLKDIIYSVIPTAGTYGGYLNGFAPQFFSNAWLSIGVGLAGSVILALFLRSENMKRYKQGLAEILATGYFMNFTGKLGRLLRSKMPVEFTFPDGSVRSFTPDKISVEIGMPADFNALTKYAESVEQRTGIVYVNQRTSSEPYWLRGVVEKDNLIVYEFPRTLFSLSKYLKDDFSDKAGSEKNSKLIYSFFQKKIDQLKREYSHEIANERLHFRPV